MKAFIRLCILSLCTIHYSHTEIIKHVLDNGLTVLIHQTQTSQPVSVKLFYNVGSKHENNNEKGIAHLLEHMVFKGTHTMSETDIPFACQTMSAEFNAATSHDWTMFYFNIPLQYWKHAFTMLSDCMHNCTFKQDLLNAELHVVIQELKMYKDYYTQQLLEKMDANLFTDHPYHYPVIGFKHDLWRMTHDNLMAFYKKHYHPNNAVLVVVGNIDPQEVIEHAQSCFAAIPKDQTYTSQTFTHIPDTCTNSITLYRAVSQPSVILAWEIPGYKEGQSYPWTVLSHLLVNSHDSNIQTELVDNQQLVYSIGAGIMIRFDSGYFIIEFEPKDLTAISKITQFIHAEIENLITNGISTEKLKIINRTTQSHHYNLMQNNNAQSSIIGTSYLATGDKDRLFNYIINDLDQLKELLTYNVQTYIRPHLMNSGCIVPSNESQQSRWHEIQLHSDAQDSEFLADKIRISTVEPPQWATTIEPQNPIAAQTAVPKQFTLSNGIKVLLHDNDTIPKVTLKLQLQVDHLYDPEGKEGLCCMMKSCMFEGTNNYPHRLFIKTCQDNAIDISYSGKTITISTLQEDLPHALELLHELLTNCSFDTDAIERVRDQLKAEYNQFWDNPQSFVWQLIESHIFKNHPFERCVLGTPETICSITKKDIVEFYNTYITPDKAVISIVGDLQHHEIETLLQNYLGSWEGPNIPNIEFPEIADVQPDTISYPIDRDQVVLVYAGKSINRLNEQYYQLALFDTILSQRLFELREQYGIFYTMSGASVTNESEQPGTCFISTIVSPQHVDTVKSIIEYALQEIPKSITDVELEYAKQSLLEIPSRLYATNNSTAQAFLFLNKYNLPYDYAKYLQQQLDIITLKDVQRAAQEILDPQRMSIFQVGRV